jgi:uncharacterized damage-inducible protein DinB
MGHSATLLPEYDQETANTRKMLARIPEDRLDWGPHPKSMTLRGLATHLSNLPRWTVLTLEKSEFDVAPASGEPYREAPVGSVATALSRFDASVAAARKSIENTSEPEWQKPWALLAGGNVIFSMPRTTVVRSFILNHLVHHRAQLGVYLRLCDVAVPQVYGPTADEA